MSDDRQTLETELQKYEAQLKSLNSYIKELKDRTTQHGTAEEHFEVDLREAEHNVQYYEGEVARLKELMGKEGGHATYFVYTDTAGEWRWRLRAANNRIIADSSEGYHNKQDCLDGIALVKNSADAPVKEGQ